MNFEWDENKNKINQRKHGVSFEEAQTVFYDDEALVRDDPDNSDYEERFIIRNEVIKCVKNTISPMREKIRMHLD